MKNRLQATRLIQPAFAAALLVGAAVLNASVASAQNLVNSGRFTVKKIWAEYYTGNSTGTWMQPQSVAVPAATQGSKPSLLMKPELRIYGAATKHFTAGGGWGGFAANQSNTASEIRILVKCSGPQPSPINYKLSYTAGLYSKTNGFGSVVSPGTTNTSLFGALGNQINHQKNSTAYAPYQYSSFVSTISAIPGEIGQSSSCYQDADGDWVFLAIIPQSFQISYQNTKMSGTTYVSWDASSAVYLSKIDGEPVTTKDAVDAFLKELDDLPNGWANGRGNLAYLNGFPFFFPIP